MAGGVDGAPAGRLGQLGLHLLEGGGVVRHAGAGDADALHQALGEDGHRGVRAVVGQLTELVLQGRRAGVDDKDEHGGLLPGRQPWAWAWMAVMATVLTMSSTVVPRERSLTGLFRPCSTGPTATAPEDCWTAL